jgi:MFS family permease
MNLIQVQHYTATQAGAALLPFILLVFLLSRWSGGLLDRYGAKRPLVIGPLIAAGGFLLFARPGIGGTYWATFFPAVVLLGLGMAVSVAPLTATVMNSVDRQHVGVASGSTTPSRGSRLCWQWQFFGALLSAVFQAVLTPQMEGLAVSPPERADIEGQRSKLAAIKTKDARARQAVEESFVTGSTAAFIYTSPGRFDAIAFVTGA